MYVTKNRRLRAGFTLIELIVVIVILGILAAVAVPKFMNMRRAARIAALESFAGSLRSGLDMLEVSARAMPNLREVLYSYEMTMQDASIVYIGQASSDSSYRPDPIYGGIGIFLGCRFLSNYSGSPPPLQGIYDCGGFQARMPQSSVPITGGYSATVQFYAPGIDRAAGQLPECYAQYMSWRSVNLGGTILRYEPVTLLTRDC